MYCFTIKAQSSNFETVKTCSSFRARKALLQVFKFLQVFRVPSGL